MNRLLLIICLPLIIASTSSGGELTATPTTAKQGVSSTQKYITWTGVSSIKIDGAMYSSPYTVPVGRKFMTVKISGGAGGGAGNNGELREFAGLPISETPYTIVLGQPGQQGDDVPGRRGGIISGGGGGGGASTIKNNGTYVAGAAGGTGADGVPAKSSQDFASGGAGGGGDVAGRPGDTADCVNSDCNSGGGSGGLVNTGGLPVGGSVIGTGNGYLEIITQ